MSRICQVTGKRPQTGHRVSHAHNKSKRRFLPNLHSLKFWFEQENRWVKLRVSNHGLRTIEKKGLAAVFSDMKKKGISSKKV